MEEDVRILRGAALYRVFGAERVAAETLQRLPVQHFAELLIVPDRDFLELVGGAEPVKEVEERDPTLDGGQVGDRAPIHHFLHA